MKPVISRGRECVKPGDEATCIWTSCLIIHKIIVIYKTCIVQFLLYLKLQIKD